jgi:hypothetical protein
MATAPNLTGVSKGASANTVARFERRTYRGHIQIEASPYVHPGCPSPYTDEGHLIVEHAVAGVRRRGAEDVLHYCALNALALS